MSKASLVPSIKTKAIWSDWVLKEKCYPQRDFITIHMGHRVSYFFQTISGLADLPSGRHHVAGTFACQMTAQLLILSTFGKPLIRDSWCAEFHRTATDTSKRVQVKRGR